MTKQRLQALGGVLLFVWAEMFLRSFFPSLTPSLTVIGVVFYALYEGPAFGAILGAWAGFFSDLLIAGPMGQEMLILGSVGFVAALSSGFFFRESALTSGVLPPLMMLWAFFWRIAFLKPGESIWSRFVDLWQLADFFQIVVNLAASILIFNLLSHRPRRRDRAYSYHV